MMRKGSAQSPSSHSSENMHGEGRDRGMRDVGLNSATRKVIDAKRRAGLKRLASADRALGTIASPAERATSAGATLACRTFHRTARTGAEAGSSQPGA